MLFIFLQAEELQKRADQAKHKSADDRRRQAEATKMARSSVDKRLVKQMAQNASLVHQSYHKLKLEIEQGFGDCSKLLETVSRANNPSLYTLV